MALIHPIRLNKVRILWQRLRKDLTLIDPDFRETIGEKTFDAEVELFGQINIFNGKYQQMARTKTGNKNVIMGRVTFSQQDLDNLGFSISVGDKFTKYGPVGGERTLNVRAIHVRPLGQMISLNRNVLLEVSFTDDYDETESIK